MNENVLRVSAKFTADGRTYPALVYAVDAAPGSPLTLELLRWPIEQTLRYVPLPDTLLHACEIDALDDTSEGVALRRAVAVIKLGGTVEMTSVWWERLRRCAAGETTALRKWFSATYDLASLTVHLRDPSGLAVWQFNHRAMVCTDWAGADQATIHEHSVGRKPTDGDHT